MPLDAFISGSIANNMSRTQSTGSSELDQLQAASSGMAAEPEQEPRGDEDTALAVVGANTIEAGDLVELR